MSMIRKLLLPALAVAAGSASLIAAHAQDAAPKGDPVRGKTLFFNTGCYQCHGFEGATSGPGPRLAPDPEDYAPFLAQLRAPRARMPIYTAKIMPDQDVADIYAYMKAQPKAKSPADIPLLNQ